MPDDLRPLVLDVCLALMAWGVYPSVVAIRKELRYAYGYIAIMDARSGLLATGELPPDARYAVFRLRRADAPRGGIKGGIPAERDAIDRTAAEIRAELADRTIDDPRPVTGKLLIDQMASPGLDGLSLARVSAILRRRCRGMFPARRQATA